MKVNNNTKAAGELAVREMSEKAQKGYADTDPCYVYTDGEQFAVKIADDPIIYTDKNGAEELLESLVFDADDE